MVTRDSVAPEVQGSTPHESEFYRIWVRLPMGAGSEFYRIFSGFKGDLGSTPMRAGSEFSRI